MADETLTPEKQAELNSLLDANKDILKELNRERIKGKNIDAEAYEAAVDNIQKYSAELKKHEDAIKASKKAIEDYNKAVKTGGEALDSIIPGMSKLTDLFEKGEDGSIDMAKGIEELAISLSKSFNSALRETAKGIENVNVSLAKQTGYSSALRKDVIALASSHDGLYLTMDEGQKILGALSTGFRMYNAQSEQTRARVNSLAGRFTVLGADASQTAEVLDQMNVIFGGMTDGAIAATAELENLAIRTGQPLGAVMTDFQALGPEMARFGIDGVRVFTRLNEQARSLGLATRQAFDISELFDTFESSADVAGKLNAQLGLQLNSVELMTATSEDRLNILRAEFDLRGMSMKDMGRRQKQMIAEILKTDVLTAERLLGDPMAMREFQREQENNAERVKQFTSAMDKFSAASEQLFINLSPLIESIMYGVNKLAEGLNWIISSPLGTMISKLGFVGSLMTSIYSVARWIGIAFKQVARAVMFFLTPLLLAKDIIQSMGLLGTNAEDQAAATARLQAGAAGAVAGAAYGGMAGGGVFSAPAAGFGALFGYGIGREAGQMAHEYSNDKIQSGPAMLRTSQGLTRLAAGDTMVASKGGGELSQLVKGVNELLRVTKSNNEKPMTAVVKIGKDEIASAVFDRMDTVRSRNT